MLCQKTSLLLLICFCASVISFSQNSTFLLCSGGGQTLNAGLTGSSAHWEVNNGAGFIPLLDGAEYSGTNTKLLHILNASTDKNGSVYRCVVDNQFSDIFIARFSNEWIGQYSPLWKDYQNWSCGILPDSNTNVIITHGHILIDSNTTIKSISINEDAKLQLAAGVHLTITGTSQPLDVFNLTEKDVEHLDTIGVPVPTLAQILPFLVSLPNRKSNFKPGNAPPTLSQTIISDMLFFSRELSEPKETIEMPEEPDYFDYGERIKRPAHWGFAYKSGGRFYGDRVRPLFGNYRHRTNAVFGVDCSGFMYQIMNFAKVPVSADITTGDFVAPIRTAITNSPGLNNKIKLENLGYLAQSFLKNGDILLWGSHVGVYYDLGALGKQVYQSNGTGTPSTDAKQLKNLGKERGIHPISYDKCIYVNPTDPAKSYWGTGYTVLRLVDFEVITNTNLNLKATPGVNTISAITDSSAHLSGEVISSGSSSIIARGMCWTTNISKQPTIKDMKTVDGSGVGIFSSDLQQLLAGIKYAARAYAINATDTVYGNTVVFNTNGTMDTVATLIAHGVWQAYHYGDSSGVYNILGEIQDDYEQNPPCQGLLTGRSSIDSVQIKFSTDISFYREFHFDKWSRYISYDPCVLEPPVTTYEWESEDIQWNYDPDSRIIKFNIRQLDGSWGNDFGYYFLNSISGDELQLDVWDIDTNSKTGIRQKFK